MPGPPGCSERVAEVFEHDDVAVFPVVSGTAANSLGLSALCPPWGSVLCHDTAHIFTSEGGATSLFTSAVMRGLSGDDHGRLTPAAIEAALAATRWGDPHHSQPAVVSLTQPTEVGTVYPLDQLRAVIDVARGAVCVPTSTERGWPTPSSPLAARRPTSRGVLASTCSHSVLPRTGR